MKGLLRDILLALAVLLALPIGMVGPALTLPALVYGFPLVLLAVLAGLAALLLQRHGSPPASRAAIGMPLGTGRPKPGRAPAHRSYDVAPLPAQQAILSPLPSVRVSLHEAGNGRLRAASLDGAPALAGGPFSRLLVVLDPEDFSPQALARAVATARRDGAELVLASVMEAEEAWRRGPARGNLSHHPAALRARLGKELENLCWRALALGVRARRRVELDDPAQRVPELALEEEADAVILVPRRPRLFSWGSSAPEWASGAPVPVLALSA